MATGGRVTVDDDNLPKADDAVRAVEEGQTVRIRDETPHSMFVEVRTEDGWTQMNKSKNARNVLLYKHGMHDLVHGSDETVWQYDPDGTLCQVSSDQKSTYTLWVGDKDPVHTSPDKEQEVLEAIKEALDRESSDPLDRVHQVIRDNQVRHDLMNRLLDEPPFSVLAERGVIHSDDRGWIIRDNLVLTWEGDLLNDTDTATYSVSGSGVRRVDSTNNAFDLDIDAEDIDMPSLEIDGKEYRFGQQEMEFIATALWVVKNVTRGGGGGSRGTPGLE